ncbi:rod shape-determining protein [Streptomyces sp. NPDC127069]|uniref:rod shape-determining protein n=1 Tax=Streptomyces sp. NPDC127069 TaxID=3347128 RepID=UPI003650CE9E
MFNKKVERERIPAEDVDILTISLTDNLLVRINQRTVFDGPPVVSDGSNGEVLAGTSAQEPVRRVLTQGVIGNIRVLEQLLQFIAKPLLDERAKMTVALVVVNEKVYKLDRTVLKELVRKVWGADVRVVIAPESKLVAHGAGTPLWGSMGVGVSLLTPNHTSSAVLSSGEVIVHDFAYLDEGADSTLRLSILNEVLNKVVRDAGPAFEQTLKNNGVTVASDDKETAIPDKLYPYGEDIPIRAVTAGSAKEALFKGILAYETYKVDLFEKGYIRSSK